MLLHILRIVRLSFVHGDEIYLGRLNNSRLLEWNDSNVQSFIRNLLRYAVLRDGFRAEYKKSK